MTKRWCDRLLYNELGAYRIYLESKFSKETARTYYHRLCTLFEGQDIVDTNNFDINKIISKLSEIEYKNHFSQAKNALFHYCEFQDITLSAETLENIKALEQNTRKKYRKFEEKDYKEIRSKISHIKNEKLKLSYQVLSVTGLRVFELSQITPSDCLVNNDFITFSFIAKGGAREDVTILKEEHLKLYQDIKKQIEKISQNKKLFYSAIYLQTKAKELGFACHDLRRVYAKLEYKKSKSKKEVMKKLRHKSIKNTNKYLKSKIKI